MPEFFALRILVAFVERRRRYLHGGASDYLQSIPLESKNLLRIVCDNAHLFHAEIDENLRSDTVITFVGRQTQRFVGFDRIGPAILQFVGTQLVGKTDAAAFLAQIEKHAATLARDELHRTVALRAAIATYRMQGVAGQTFR